MMGPKKLGQIRRELRTAVSAEVAGPAAWFDRQIRKLRGVGPPDRRDLETLLLLRDALAAATPVPPARKRKATARR